MKHIDTQILVDYYDGCLGQEKSGEIDEHLSVCEVCQAALASVRQALDLADGNQPIASRPDLIRRAATAFRCLQSKTSERLVKQTTLNQFDSWANANAAGTRRGLMQERQLLFTCDHCDIDVQIAFEPLLDSFVVHGQMFVHIPESEGLEGLEVRLFSQEHDERIVLTDALGQFTFSMLSEGTYSLKTAIGQYEVLIETLEVRR